MNRDETSDILGILASGYPGTYVSAQMLDTWGGELLGAQVDLVSEVAMAWIRDDSHRWPTLGEFRTAIADAERLELDRRALRPAVEPEYEWTEETTAKGLASIRFMREIVQRAGAGRPMSDEEVTSEAERRGLVVDEGSERDLWMICRDCEDKHWIAQPGGRMIPCGRCIPMTYERWRGGHFQPNHECEECRQMRKTRRA